MAEIKILYWRDIPAQIIAQKSRREQVKRVLDERFEKAIDRAAMQAGMEGTDDYLLQWRKSDGQPCSDDIAAEAEKHALKLETCYDAKTLSDFVKNGGYQPK